MSTLHRRNRWAEADSGPAVVWPFDAGQCPHCKKTDFVLIYRSGEYRLRRYGIPNAVGRVIEVVRSCCMASSWGREYTLHEGLDTPF